MSHESYFQALPRPFSKEVDKNTSRKKCLFQRYYSLRSNILSGRRFFSWTGLKHRISEKPEKPWKLLFRLSYSLYYMCPIKSWAVILSSSQPISGAHSRAHGIHPITVGHRNSLANKNNWKLSKNVSLLKQTLRSIELFRCFSGLTLSPTS